METSISQMENIGNKIASQMPVPEDLGVDARPAPEEQIMKLESAKVSADSALAESKISSSIVSTLGGVLGVLVLFSSISNLAKDFRAKKTNPWTYSRIMIDFSVSGGLIGYAFGHMFLGLEAGFIIGILVLILELIFIRKNKI